MGQGSWSVWAESGLFLCACAFIVSGLFDIVYDVWWLVSCRHRQKVLPSTAKPAQEQWAAILIPAFQESEVIRDTLQYLLRTQRYERYRVFVATYLNDPKTLAVIEDVASQDDRVISVRNQVVGPTTKGQCLNSILDAIDLWEVGHEVQFTTFLFQDAEDIIHPESLNTVSEVLTEHSAVQLSILPVTRPWHSFIHWIYADEFAEGQIKDLLVRGEQSGFVPFLGVGFGLSRALITRLRIEGNGLLFQDPSQTEDYSLALRLARGGVLVKFIAPTKAFGGRLANYALFPTTFIAAVRQRSRWIIGICLEEWMKTGWKGSFRLKFVLAKDRRMLLAPILAFGSLLCSVVLFRNRIWYHGFGPSVVFGTVWGFTILRCWQRAFFVTQIYGWKAGALSIVRLPLAVLLNVFATCRAISVFVSHALGGKPILWCKTSHTRFPLGPSKQGADSPLK